MNTKNIQKYFTSTTIGLILLFTVSTVVFAGTFYRNTATPPANNTDTPIDVGSAQLQKTGSLGVGQSRLLKNDYKGVFQALQGAGFTGEVYFNRGNDGDVHNKQRAMLVGPDTDGILVFGTTPSGKVGIRATGYIAAKRIQSDTLKNNEMKRVCADSKGTLVLCGASNGMCGSATSTSLSSAPTTNLCSSGTVGTVSGNGPWSWTCEGSGFQAADASCTTQKTSCGSAQTVASESAPTSSLCGAGATATTVGISGANWAWSCTGGDSASVSCQAPIKISGAITQLLPRTAENVDSNENYKFVFTKPTPIPLKALIGEIYTGCSAPATNYDVAYGWQLFPDLPGLTHTVGTSISGAYGDSSYPLYIEIPAGVTTFKSNIGVDYVYGRSNIKEYNLDTNQVVRIGHGWYGQYFNCQHTRDTFVDLLDGVVVNFSITNPGITIHNVNN